MPSRDLNEAEVRDIAVRYLTRREYAVEELRQKLLQRGADRPGRLRGSI